MSSAITVSLCVQGKQPLAVRCTHWPILCICQTEGQLAAPSLSLSFVALRLGLYFEVKAPMLLLIKEAWRTWVLSQLNFRYWLSPRCCSRGSISPSVPFFCAGPGGFSARWCGSAGTKVWLRRSGGKVMGRLKLKVRFVSELARNYYRTREQEGSCKVSRADCVPCLVRVVMQLQYFPNVFL